MRHPLSVPLSHVVRPTFRVQAYEVIHWEKESLGNPNCPKCKGNGSTFHRGFGSDRGYDRLCECAQLRGNY